MALGICMKCLKYLVFVINLLFWLAGMGLLAASIYIRCYPDDIEKAVGASADNSLYTVTYIFMAIGGLMTVVGFLGCCGAYQESPCIIASFIILLILILVGEITGIVVAYVLKADIKENMDDGFKNVISTRNLTDTKSKMFLWLQENLHCCGSTERSDWVCNSELNSHLQHACQYNNDLGTYRTVELEKEIEKKLKVPKSCCTKDSKGEYPNDCGDASNKRLDWKKRTYSEGCSNRVVGIFQQHINKILGAIAGVIVMEILILAAAFVLCCSFRRQIEEESCYGGKP